MTAEEIAAWQHLKVHAVTPINNADEEEMSTMSLAEILKKRKRRRLDSVQTYMNLWIILVWSAEIEGVLIRRRNAR